MLDFGLFELPLVNQETSCWVRENLGLYFASLLCQLIASSESESATRGPAFNFETILLNLLLFQVSSA